MTPGGVHDTLAPCSKFVLLINFVQQTLDTGGAQFGSMEQQDPLAV